VTTDETSKEITNSAAVIDDDTKHKDNPTSQPMIPWPHLNGSKDKSDLQLLQGDLSTKFHISPTSSGAKAVTTTNKKQPMKPKRFASISNECKATKTLGIIMGAFTACWLPFFILALVKPLCSDSGGGAPDESSCIPHWLNSLFQWLGYANSFLNPIIYARFNRDFRTPFKEILLLRCRGINLRLRTESYAEQYGADGGAGTALKRRINSTCNTVVRYQSAGQTAVRLVDGGNCNTVTSST